MTPTETVRLMAVARAAYPGMTIPDGMAEVWHKLLHDLPYPAAEAALFAHAADDSRIPVPADIRRRAKAARQDAIARRPALDAPIRATDPGPEWHALKDELAKRRAAKADKGEPTALGDALAGMAAAVEAKEPTA